MVLVRGARSFRSTQSQSLLRQADCGMIHLFKCRSMRHLLAAAAVVGTSLTAISPANAKSFWLKCGSQVINLDSARERFSLTNRGAIYQGPAIFSPGQINFEYQWFTYSDDLTYISKWAYAIDRKSLGYTRMRSSRLPLDSLWLLAPEDKRDSGKCSIMKTPPTSGNQI
jgi:hypothetical protein